MIANHWLKWVAGVTQGLMWRAFDAEGTRLLYPSFTDTVTRLIPLCWVRFVGGAMYLAGVLLMAWNFIKTVNAPAPATEPTASSEDHA